MAHNRRQFRVMERVCMVFFIFHSIIKIFVCFYLQRVSVAPSKSNKPAHGWAQSVCVCGNYCLPFHFFFNSNQRHFFAIVRASRKIPSSTEYVQTKTLHTATSQCALAVVKLHKKRNEFRFYNGTLIVPIHIDAHFILIAYTELPKKKFHGVRNNQWDVHIWIWLHRTNKIH